jgi:Rrf2 family protein
MRLKRVNAYALHALIYMVRHSTLLPLTLQSISKAEGIPYRQLVNIFRLLSEAGIVAISDSEQGGYVFKRSPADVTLLELFELVEGYPLFDECLLKQGDCMGTAENCIILQAWKQATQSLAKKLSEISIDKAAWGHPEHSFHQCCLGVEAPEES